MKIVFLVCFVAFAIESSISSSVVERSAPMVKTFFENLSKVVYREYQKDNADVARSLVKSLKSSGQAFEIIFGASCTSNDDSFCGFLGTLRDVTKQYEDKIVDVVGSWGELSQTNFAEFSESIKQTMIDYYMQFDHLMSSKRLGCYFTQIRHELESHKEEAEKMMNDFFTESKASFADQIEQSKGNINAYKSTAVKVYEKCSTRDDPQECANKFIQKAPGLVDEYKGVLARAFSLVEDQLRKVGPGPNVLVETCEANTDQFEKLLRTCEG